MGTKIFQILIPFSIFFGAGWAQAEDNTEAEVWIVSEVVTSENKSESEPVLVEITKEAEKATAQEATVSSCVTQTFAKNQLPVGILSSSLHLQGLMAHCRRQLQDQ